MQIFSTARESKMASRDGELTFRLTDHPSIVDMFLREWVHWRFRSVKLINTNANMYKTSQKHEQ